MIGGPWTDCPAQTPFLPLGVCVGLFKPFDVRTVFFDLACEGWRGSPGSSSAVGTHLCFATDQASRKKLVSQGSHIPNLSLYERPNSIGCVSKEATWELSLDPIPLRA